jgi:hypothetical protein
VRAVTFRPPIAALAAALVACGSLDVSSDNDSPLGRTAVISSAVGLALSFGTTGLITGGNAAGHALESRREVSTAIARGSGPFVTDLAAWLELPDALVPVLGGALRDARPILEPALDEPITVESFSILLGIAVCKEPKLRYHAWKRFNCERLVPLARLPSPG